MVRAAQRFGSAAAAFAAAMLLCQCETTRTVKSTRTSFSFDEKHWGDKASDDSDKIRSQFAERGYSIGEDGTIQADRSDLHSGSRARGFDSAFGGRKEARLGRGEIETKSLGKPEYLQRQEFREQAPAREGAMAAARESGSRNRETGRLFARRGSSEPSSDLGTHATRGARGVDRTHATREDREGTEARRNSAAATGSPFQAGYEDSQLTMDEVKRMLSPGTYARATGISQ